MRIGVVESAYHWYVKDLWSKNSGVMVRIVLFEIPSIIWILYGTRDRIKVKHITSMALW